MTGGPGGATLVGAANNALVYQNASPSTGAIFVAGGGSETLFGAASTSNDQYWGSFSGGSDLMVAGSGNDILVAGGGTDTLVGGAGTDAFYVINPEAISAMTGNPPDVGHYTVFNAHPGDMIALASYDSLYGVSGSHAAASAVSAAPGSGVTAVTLGDGSTISSWAARRD